MPEQLARLLAELPNLGPWAIASVFIAWLARAKELTPFRKWLWADLFDRLLRARGVDEQRRHAILIAAACKAQDITMPDLPTLSEPQPKAGGVTPARQPRRRRTQTAGDSGTSRRPSVAELRP